jgi:uncharacterized membrane protein YhaH (DUF805 family)
MPIRTALLHPYGDNIRRYEYWAIILIVYLTTLIILDLIQWFYHLSFGSIYLLGFLSYPFTSIVIEWMELQSEKDF